MIMMTRPYGLLEDSFWIVEAVGPFKRDLIKTQCGNNPLDGFGLVNQAVHAAHDQGLATCVSTLQHLVISKACLCG